MECGSLRHRCSFAGRPCSTVLRQLSSGLTIRQRPPKELHDLYAETNRIGTNINQIARKTNAGFAKKDEMSELLFAHFGVMPSETLRTLYRQAIRTVNDRTLTMDEVCSQLAEPAPHGGAMVCEYDFFKILYRSEARSIARNGHSANICLLSVSGKDGEMLARRSLDPAMNNLQVLVQNNLRRGDVIARCSISQYIILLPQANYENSRMVADRLVSAFYRRYPHSPARLRYTVQPLT